MDTWKTRCTWNQADAKSSSVQIDTATEKFIADAEARGLHESTVYKYKLLFKQLTAFAVLQGIRFISEFDVDALTTYRSAWKLGPRSSCKQLERLRAFFRFCERRKWISENPAQGLKPPKVSLCPTLPFAHDEMVRIIAATNQYIEQTSANGKDNGRRLPAMILLMRYSGMRIGDTVNLTVDRLSGNRLFLYTAKTGVPVFTVLPDFVVEALEKTPRVSVTRYFWSGGGSSTLRFAFGKRGCVDFSKLPKLRTGMRTGSAIPLLWNSCWLACRWNGFQFCWGTLRSESRKNIIRPGFDRGRNSLRRT